MRASLLFLSALCILPALASEPGNPLIDCEDWVILDPRLTCVEVENPCEHSSRLCGYGETQRSHDNEGNLLSVIRSHSVVDEIEVGYPEPCGNTIRSRYSLVQMDLSAPIVPVTQLAYIDDRCVSESPAVMDAPIPGDRQIFDPFSGTLYMTMSAQCLPQSALISGLCGDYTYDPSIPSVSRIAFTGFPTLRDVLAPVTGDGDDDDDDDDDHAVVDTTHGFKAVPVSRVEDP